MSQQALRKQKLEKLQQISSMRILAKQVMFVQTVLLHGKILHLWSTERKSDWNLIFVYKGKGQETKQNKAQGRLWILICFVQIVKGSTLSGWEGYLGRASEFSEF